MGWIRSWRRRRWGRREFPEAWLKWVESLPFYAALDTDMQARFRRALQIFIFEKHFFGAGGLVITERMKVVIAAAAVRLILHLDLSLYDRLTEIVVYPHAFRNPKAEGDIHLGEAHRFGTVVLSWPAVQWGMRYPCDGRDTALHEFAHVLDKEGGGFDGTPRLRAEADYGPWAEVMSQHFFRLQGSRWPEKQLLRQYGAKNEAEFFAVVTEVFFERPHEMKALTPDLFAELIRFYGFEPQLDPSCH